MPNDQKDAPPELVAWFSENLTHDRFRDWSDEQFAAALVADQEAALTARKDMARAWDEGYAAGYAFGYEWAQDTYDGPVDGPTPNPYRPISPNEGGAA